MNPFIKDVSEYTRDYKLRKAGVEQVALYIASMRNISIEEATEFVVNKLKSDDPKFGFKDPDVLRLKKVSRGKREEDTTGFIDYIEEADSEGLIISPSLVTYLPPKVRKSVTAAWLTDNIAARGRAKFKMFQFEQIGDIVKAGLANGEQNARKIRINTVSGQRGFKGNALFLTTGHSTLTSTCRAAAGYGNAIIERFVAGARHYHTFEVARANILAVATMADLDGIKTIVEKYNLCYPTPEQAFSVVHRSTKLYVSNKHEEDLILELLTKITPVQRAAFCYGGDMYHIAKFNDEFARRFISEMIMADGLPEEYRTLDIETKVEVKKLSGSEKAYVNALCLDVLAGETYENVEENDKEGWKTIGRTSRSLKDNLNKYSDFISTLLAVNHLPPTVGSLRSIQRRVCLAADTDSAIFTTQGWVEWYKGDLKRTILGDRVWYLITYMGCECIANALAILSGNMGVDPDMTFMLAMKNEYSFPEFALTSMAKNYFASMSMREGNVFKKPRMEVKGVELRGSKMPAKILKAADDMMAEILHKVDNSILIDEDELLERIAGFEKDTVDSIMKGDPEYLTTGSIKADTARTIHYDLWMKVFSPKYGESVPPPYPTVSISTDLDNKTKLKEFIAGVKEKDPALGNRLQDWIIEHRRDNLKTIMLPIMSIRQCGIPDELRSAVNVRKLAYQINSAFYAILESIGLNIVDRDHHRLVSDYLGLDL